MHGITLDNMYVIMYLNFAKDIFSPTFLSATNPVIFFICCQSARYRLARLFVRAKTYASVITMSKASELPPNEHKTDVVFYNRSVVADSVI